MPHIVRFWDALPRFGHPPSRKQPAICPESSGLGQAISELVQRCGEALRHGFERAPDKAGSKITVLVRGSRVGGVGGSMR